MKKIFFLLVIVFMLTSCSILENPTKDSIAKSEKVRNENPVVNIDDQAALVKGNNEFGISLYKSLAEENTNIIFSPYSISVALAMAQAGARNQTLNQMNDVLHFALPQDSLHQTFNALQLALNSREQNNENNKEKDFELNIANAIWGEKTYTFLPEYLDLLAENYGAGIRLMDFKNNTDGSRKEINQWIIDETDQKIKDLLAEGTITPQTRLVLTNAIYFKAEWMSQFEEDRTKPDDFTLLDGNVIQVPMMTQSGNFAYLQGDGFQAVSLPYKGNKLSMLILLPDQGNFDQIKNEMSADQLSSLMNNLQNAEVDLSMPKFKVESSFGLKDVLSEMGMPDAFEPGTADLSGMDGTKDLYISAVEHKAYIDVDENGTEAAAATAIVVGLTSMPVEVNKLKIDRPFVYFILDNETGTILFMGQMLDPNS
jgi:serpin B